MRTTIKKILKQYGWQLELLLFLVLSLLWVLPWATSGKLYTGDDLGFHLNRIQGLAQQLKLGGHWWQIPAVSTTAFSQWGYPINLFYPAVTLLPAAWLQALVPGLGGYYLYLILLTLATLVIAAAVAHKLLGNRALGILAAVLYTFAQYRFLDFFVRGALAEGVVFAFLPIVFYGVYCLAYGDDRQWYWLAVGMALVALTHVVSLLLCAVGVVLMASLWFLRREGLARRSVHLGYAAGFAIFLAATFLAPLAEQLKTMGKLGVQQYTLITSATEPGELLRNSLDNALSSSQINFGIIFILLTVLALVVWRKLLPLDRYCLIIAWVFIFLATKLFPWQLFQNLLGAIQFPWRFLALACFPLALVGARAISVACRMVTVPRQFLVVGIATIAVVGLSLSLNNQLYQQTTSANTKIVTAATYPAVASGDITTDYVSQKGQVSMAAVRTHSIPVMNTQTNGQQLADLQQQGRQTVANGFIYQITSEVPQIIKLPQIFYPGYHVTVNGRTQRPSLDANGVVHVKVPTGRSTISYRYQRTMVQRLAAQLSFWSWLFLLATPFWRRYGSGLQMRFRAYWQAHWIANK